MNLIQVKPVSQAHQISFPQLIRNFKAALSYVSFYSGDSPFVVQAVQKCHKDLQKLLQAFDSLVLYLEGNRLLLNGSDLSELDDLLKIFQDKNVRGVEFTSGVTVAELTVWLKQISLPVSDPVETAKSPSHIHVLSLEDAIKIGSDTESSEETTVAPLTVPLAQKETVKEGVFLKPLDVPPVELLAKPAAPLSEAKDIQTFSLKEILNDENISLAFTTVSPETEARSTEALLSFVAEAWQYSQLQKKNLNASAEMAGLALSFEKLFDRLLDRLEKSSPEFAHIYDWFRTPQGELMQGHVASSMYPLLEIAVRNNWMAVLFDPATEGLVNECLAYWGANGKQELVEKAVHCLAQSLSGDSFERQLALTHLMDARPWVRQTKLLQEVLNHLNSLLATETTPGLYQTALLLAWDLMEPALADGNEPSALTLLSTLHFHADEDIAAFPERARIARHWLFERSTPDLIRRFVLCACKTEQMDHFPLLGEMAAPLLLNDFLSSSSPDKSGYLKLFAAMKEPIRSALTERLADIQDEADIHLLIPILRVCGMDPGLSIQLSAWLSRGSRELKLDLLGLIEEVGDPAGGPALRLAVLDDSEEISAMAARVIGKIRFTAGLRVLLKAAKIREGRFSNNDAFLTSVCQSLGDLAVPEGMGFLQDIARKKPLLRGKNFSLPVRLEAIRALTKINQPEVWSFLEALMEEKNPVLQETLDKIIHEKIQTL
jgi:hypothetical protein